MATSANSQDNNIQRNSDTSIDFLTGYDDINSFVQAALRAIMLATKASNLLPSGEDDYDYYSSFPTFRQVTTMENNRLLHMMQTSLRYHGIKGNVASTREGVDIDDRFDAIIDANDQFLERIGLFLDEASGIKKDDTSLVVTSVTPRGPVSGSWNKGGKKGDTFKLLAAKGIQRPQAKFKDKVDNTSRPFVPKLRHKAHALKPIPESIMAAQAEDVTHSRQDGEFIAGSVSYPHPYQFELDELTWRPWQLAVAEPIPAAPIAANNLIMVTELSGLLDMCNVLVGKREVAVDLEHHSYRTFLGITCLMQISTRMHDYIIDTLLLRNDLHHLNEVFANPDILKVLHGADSDIGWLQRDFGLYIVNMFDTGQAARALGLARFSLAYLLDKYCKVDADKQYQLADWRIRPLPAELVRYARDDTHYLLYIYDHMRNELSNAGNEQSNLLVSVLQRSRALCGMCYEKPCYTEDTFLDLYYRSNKRFNSRQLAALRAIHTWRDNTARLEDESLGYVLPNHMMFEMANTLPREKQGVLACCNPIPPLVRQHLTAIHDIIMEARESPLEDVTGTERSPRTLAPGRSQQPKYHSVLHCPHDMSHQDKPIKLYSVDPSLQASSSSMFGSHTPNDITELCGVPYSDIALLPVPSISAFAPQSHQFYTGLQRAIAVKSALASPFAMYLPTASKTAECMGEEASQMTWMAGEGMWRLQAPAEKLPFNTVVTVVESFAQAQVDSDEEEEGVISLSQLGGAKKKKKKKKRKSDDADLGAGSGAPVGKRPPLTIETVEHQMAPHEYSEVDLDAFTPEFCKPSGSKKIDKNAPKRVYNPDGETQESHKRSSKPHLNPSSGKKSQSFGASKSQSTIK